MKDKIFEVTTFREGEVADQNRKGMTPSDAALAVMVPHEGELEFTLSRYGEFLSSFDKNVLRRLSNLEADNGAKTAGEQIAAALSETLKAPVVMVRFLVDRVFMDGNRWLLVNPKEPKNCALRPILPPHIAKEAIRAAEGDFKDWAMAVNRILKMVPFSIHPHTYTPTGTAAVLDGEESIEPYIQSHVFPKRDLRADLSPVVFQGDQTPSSPMGMYIQGCYQLLAHDRIRVGYPYGGDLPDCMATDVLRKHTGIVFEGSQMAIAANPEVMLERPWDIQVDPKKVMEICSQPAIQAALNWLKASTIEL